MKILLITLSTILMSCITLNAQSTEPAIEDLKWDATVSTSQAIFTFPRTRTNTWSWFNPDTPANLHEYGWNVTVGDHKSGYQFGPALFKPGDREQTTGSLAELMEACQHDLWEVSEDGGVNRGSFGKTKIDKEKIQIVILDKHLLKLISESRPIEIQMSITTPDWSMRKKVTVQYKKDE